MGRVKRVASRRQQIVSEAHKIERLPTHPSGTASLSSTGIPERKKHVKGKAYAPPQAGVYFIPFFPHDFVP